MSKRREEFAKGGGGVLEGGEENFFPVIDRDTKGGRISEDVDCLDRQTKTKILGKGVMILREKAASPPNHLPRRAP